MAYAILTDISSNRATATNVTSSASVVARAALHLGDNQELAIVPDGTKDGDRVHVAGCEVMSDTGPFLAQHYNG